MNDPYRRTRQPKRRDFLLLLTKINLVVLVLLCLAETFIAERHWLTTVLLYLPQQWIGIPGAVLMVWAIWRKQRKLILGNGLGLAFFVFYFLGFNVPLRIGNPFGSTASGTRLRVMTYNIRYGSRGASRIVQIMNETQPDIVCLQETRPELPGPDPVPQMKYLLPDWHLARDGEVTTFSRYPIVAHRSHTMPSKTGRVVLETQIALPERRLSVFNVHMSTAAVPTGGPAGARRSRFGMPIYTSATAAIRRRQTGILLGITSQATSPQIVMGDFNNPPRGLIYRALKGRFQDAFRAAGWGWGYTFRSDLPLMRIDYIFLGPRVHAVRSFVPRVTASDHRPVVADITVP